MPTARLLAAVPAVAPPAAGPTTVHTGEIGGAEFVVNVPDRWNGTLVLWSHGWYRNGFLPADPARQQTR